MPVETRSSCRAWETVAKAAIRPSRAPHPQATSNRVQKRKNGAAVSKVVRELQVELNLAVERTESLQDALRAISSRLKEADSNLEIAKTHHSAAMEQARESKRIICRYLELGMTIPPCKSLDLPMEVYSDESNYKLAEMIKEQEHHILRLRKSVDEVREQVQQGRIDVRRLKRKIYTQQAKSRVRDK
ncbi:hypothetical protein MPH_13225 [Macrophomina phaseolina MS6]|uniref:Uncharacterized protein n=1 Tax=Macrophomina phaseolina (strain MS6) TaxID=1126212 RepID=K2R6A0_MACPH|nr:hypothetical protein MPH_13225 [Macrophomina phaseolina MS6]